MYRKHSVETAKARKETKEVFHPAKSVNKPPFHNDPSFLFSQKDGGTLVKTTTSGTDRIHRKDFHSNREESGKTNKGSSLVRKIPQKCVREPLPNIASLPLQTRQFRSPELVPMYQFKNVHPFVDKTVRGQSNSQLSSSWKNKTFPGQLEQVSDQLILQWVSGLKIDFLRNSCQQKVPHQTKTTKAEAG